MAHKSPARRRRPTSLEGLAAFEEDCVLVVIETPKGSPNKLTFEPRYGTFVLKGVLPAGAVFPFDFGFVPSTCADDGDPLDVLVLMDAPVYPGCIVPSRLIGVIEAEQTEEGETERNDRLLRRGQLRRAPVDPPAERSQSGPCRANRTLLRLVQRDEGQTFRSETAR
jgi:Inorganic pyrophosphatase